MRFSMILPLLLATPALGGDLAYGEYLAQECTSCHRPGARTGVIPPLAGLDTVDFIEAMEDYRSGLRTNAAMGVVARSLDDEQTAALAAWFAGLAPEPEPDAGETGGNDDED